MKERPILFSAPMVRAIGDGRKTQTRRIVKRHPCATSSGPCINDEGYLAFDGPREVCPYGKPGDRLWVKESYWIERDTGEFKWYVNDLFTPVRERDNCRLRPSIHMPRKLSRLLLEITDVRGQMLHHISEEDAIAEGARPEQGLRGDDDLMVGRIAHELAPLGQISMPMPIARYVLLWDSINGKHPNNWNANPWVWAVSFKRIEGTPNA